MNRYWKTVIATSTPFVLWFWVLSSWVFENIACGFIGMILLSVAGAIFFPISARSGRWMNVWIYLGVSPFFLCFANFLILSNMSSMAMVEDFLDEFLALTGGFVLAALILLLGIPIRLILSGILLARGRTMGKRLISSYWILLSALVIIFVIPKTFFVLMRYDAPFPRTAFADGYTKPKFNTITEGDSGDSVYERLGQPFSIEESNITVLEYGGERDSIYYCVGDSVVGSIIHGVHSDVNYSHAQKSKLEKQYGFADNNVRKSILRLDYSKGDYVSSPRWNRTIWIDPEIDRVVGINSSSYLF
jgi:hypothetical protein